MGFIGGVGYEEVVVSSGGEAEDGSGRREGLVMIGSTRGEEEEVVIERDADG